MLRDRVGHDVEGEVFDKDSFSLRMRSSYLCTDEGKVALLPQPLRGYAAVRPHMCNSQILIPHGRFSRSQIFGNVFRGPGKRHRRTVHEGRLMCLDMS